MLENVTGIKIKGANFYNETELQIFASERNHKFSIVYGKNGAGKSTISRGFGCVRGDNVVEISNAKLVDKDSAEIMLLDEEKEQIHIFNEDYIDRCIRLQKEGLETIVVLGERKELEDKITNAEKELKKVTQELLKQKELCDRYADDKDLLSPQHYLKKMISSLKGDNNWAGRDAKIRGRQTNTSVRNDAYLNFLKEPKCKDRDALVREFDEKFKLLQDARSGAKTISRKAEINIDWKFDEDEYIRLITEKIEKPELSDREKLLLEYVSKTGHENHTAIVQEYFEQNTHDICPFCLQDVDQFTKDSLFKSIERILSKEAEKHKDKLTKLNIDKIEFDFEIYAVLDEEIVKKCNDLLIEINDIIAEIKNNIEAKYNNVYCLMNVFKRNLSEKINSFRVLISELEDARNIYNNQVSDIDTKIKILSDINAGIAYYDIISDFTCFEKQELEMKKARDNYRKTFDKSEEIKKAMRDLEMKRKDVEIALDFINEGLRYIFFSNGRLSIKYEDDKYKLLSRENAVTPKQISVGERNAIALCYFFSDIMKGKDEATLYTNQYTIVIDDPISSFDMENRIGIISYLKYQLQRFSSGNEKTKILVMTHDMQTLYDMQKVAKEIMMYSKEKYEGKNSSLKIYELKNKVLEDFDLKGRNEYTCLMENVYDYARGQNREYELVIGNSMRRLLEAFSTFEYKMGIDKVSTNSSILAKLGTPYDNYFENLMYRLVLNGGSHYEENIKALGDLSFFAHISSSEKERTARDILCFIYLLNDTHMLKHLSSKDNVEKTISEWLDNIATRETSKV